MSVCPGCGNVISQGDVFCGLCGLNFGSLPTVLSQKQPLELHAAPIVLSPRIPPELLHTVYSQENPYTHKKGNFTPYMSRLRYDDAQSPVWAETQMQESYARYENGLFYLYHSEGILQRPSILPRFTIQMYVSLKQLRENEGHSFFVVPSKGGDAHWQLFGSDTLWLRYQHEGQGFVTINVGSPFDSPFLLGIVCHMGTWSVFINGNKLADYHSLSSKPFTPGHLQIIAENEFVTISHTKIWVP